jgi:hypothetical protein
MFKSPQLAYLACGVTEGNHLVMIPFWKLLTPLLVAPNILRMITIQRGRHAGFEHSIDVA